MLAGKRIKIQIRSQKRTGKKSGNVLDEMHRTNPKKGTSSTKCTGRTRNQGTSSTKCTGRTQTGERPRRNAPDEPQHVNSHRLPGCNRSKGWSHRSLLSIVESPGYQDATAHRSHAGRCPQAAALGYQDATAPCSHTGRCLQVAAQATRM